MIVSPGRRYILVHSPKTGGTALSLALEARAMADDLLIGDTPKARRRKTRVKRAQGQAAGRLWKHSTLADLDGFCDPSGYFVVTLVRNPWDRVVSYYHWLRAQQWTHPAVAAAKALTFDGFVSDPAVQASLRAASYASYVTAADGRERCDLFARLECLDSDLARFETHLGFALTPVPRVNASQRMADYRGYYTERTAELVGRVAAPDIARFGYRF